MKAIKDIDGYLATQPEEARAKMETLRHLITITIPGMEETISYGMPAFRYKGKVLVGFAGWKKHIGFYPWSGSIVIQFKKELTKFSTSKGAIQFPLEKPIPVTIVKKIVKARAKEILSKTNTQRKT